MSPRRYDVLLSGAKVGVLAEQPDRVITFRFVQSYLDESPRPVLGQSFEDDLEASYSGRQPGRLPVFFWNLLPEGAYRDLLEANLKPVPEDDLALLAALGQSLPGAVEIRSAQDAGYDDVDAQPGRRSSASGALSGSSFSSLAGAQLKLSLLREHDKFVLPLPGESGDWIVKASTTDRWPGLVENEWSMLDWARQAGFDVPECRIAESSELGVLERYLSRAPRGLAVRRFDRRPGGKVHQEDLAQVFGVRPQPPEQKFDSTLQRLAEFALQAMGPEAYEELVRRIVFVVASGNNDAHLKNWSILYQDGVTPSWTPLYDQVFTGAWPEFGRELALGLPGPKAFGMIHRGQFVELARRVGAAVARTEEVVRETVRALRDTLPGVLQGVMLEEHRRELERHWERVPLLRSGE